MARTMRAVLTGVAGAALLAACGGGDGGGGMQGGTPGFYIVINGSAFSPAELRVPAGATVTVVNRDGMPEIGRKMEEAIRPHFRVFYDDSGAVGRRYRRQDEIGTPYCFTVDSQTLQDQTVTVRERDSMKQERLALDSAVRYLADRLRGGLPAL